MKPRVRLTSDGKYTVDGLQNLVSGMGTIADKRTANRFVITGSFFDWTELEASYATNWLARQIVEVPVEDALREWRDHKTQHATQIRNEESRLGVFEKYREALYWSRLYGGSGLLMITDQPLDKPLNVNAIKKGGLKRLVCFDRTDLVPTTLNTTDPTAENYLQPEYFSIARGVSQIHHSHIIICDGESLPRRLRELNNHWGDSRLRQCMDDIKDITAVKSGVATLVHESNIDVITREGLADELASGEERNILQRYALTARMKSIVNMLLLDGAEKYDRNQISFSGLDSIFQTFMTWCSGAADIPATRLFGQSPAGLNATGESDMDNYYDSVASDQEARYRPQLEKLDEVMVRSAVGSMPDDYEWSWKPLYQESGVEIAQRNLADSQSDDIRLGQGAIQLSHVMLKLKSDGAYAISDDEIERQQRLEAESFVDDDGDQDE